MSLKSQFITRKTPDDRRATGATVNKIDGPSLIPQDRISASIEVRLEKSVVVICDLAGQRQNVYYEFGYTRAIGTDVILTCPQSEAKDTKLHLGHWQQLQYADLSCEENLSKS